MSFLGLAPLHFNGQKECQQQFGEMASSFSIPCNEQAKLTPNVTLPPRPAIKRKAMISFFVLANPQAALKNTKIKFSKCIARFRPQISKHSDKRRVQKNMSENISIRQVVNVCREAYAGRFRCGQSRSSHGGRDGRYNSKCGGHNCVLLTIYFRIDHLYRRLLNSLPTSLHDSNTSGLLDRWVRPMLPSDGINKSVSACLVNAHTIFGSGFSSKSESSDMLSPGFPDSSSEDLLR